MTTLAVRAEESPALRFNTYQSDPFARFLLDVVHLTPKGFALIALAWAAALHIVAPVAIMAAMPGTYGEDGWEKYLLYLAQTGLVALNLFICPVLVGFYLWVSRAPRGLFSQLFDSRVFKVDANQKLAMSKQLGTLYSQRWAGKAALLAVALFVMWYVSWFHFGAPRFGDVPIQSEAAKSLLGGFEGRVDVGQLAVSPGILVLIYFFIMLVLRAGQTIWGLYLTFRTVAVVVEPLHPDKCGGLRPVNRYAVTCSYLIAAGGFGLGLGAFSAAFRGGLSTEYWLYAMIGIYIILAPLVFFLTLGSAHEAMKASRDRYLDTISRRFQAIYAQVNDALKEDGLKSQSESLKSHADQLQQLDALYTRTGAFPVWPLDTASLRRFFGAVSISIVPSFISIGLRLSGISLG